MIGRVDVDNGVPKHEGIYAVLVFSGWRILEWHQNQWWHSERVGKWPDLVPAKWVGPLPSPRPLNSVIKEIPKPAVFDL